MHYIIVGFVIAIILAFQVFVFIKTQGEIKQFKGLFPKKPSDWLRVYESLISDKSFVEDVEKDKKELVKLYSERNDFFVYDDYEEEISKRGIIEGKIEKIEETIERKKREHSMRNLSIYNQNFSSIINTINGYLEKNRTGNTDYHLMKDMVDRYSDTHDENISTQVPIPLYAGLMGTMIGAIIGIAYLILSEELSALLRASESQVGGKGIETLLACVAMAMAASFVGILLTTIGSICLKNAKIAMSNNKDSFLSWLQQNLLPVIANDTSSALIRVSQDLASFGTQFTQNTNKLQQTISTLNITTTDQKELIESLQQINITKVAKANVDVYDKLKDCTDEIGNLTSFLHNSQSYLHEVKELNSQLDKDDRRSKSFERMAEFFEKEYTKVDERNAIIASAIDKVDDKTRQSLSIMEENLKRQFSSLNTFLDKETDNLKNRSTEISAIIDELKKLSPLEKTISQLEHNTKEQNVKMNELMKTIENLAKAKADGGSGTILPWFSMVPLWMKIVVGLVGLVFFVMCIMLIFIMFNVIVG